MTHRTKKIFILVVALLSFVVLAIFWAQKKSAPENVLISGTIVLDPEKKFLLRDQKVIYFTLIDAELKTPLAATRLPVKSDLGDQGMTFQFSKSEFQIMPMNVSQTIPDHFDLKVRLDADGSGGMDQAGDVVGRLTNISAGAEKLSVILSEHIKE